MKFSQLCYNWVDIWCYLLSNYDTLYKIQKKKKKKETFKIRKEKKKDKGRQSPPL